MLRLQPWYIQSDPKLKLDFQLSNLNLPLIFTQSCWHSLEIDVHRQRTLLTASDNIAGSCRLSLSRAHAKLANWVDSLNSRTLAPTFPICLQARVCIFLTLKRPSIDGELTHCIANSLILYLNEMATCEASFDKRGGYGEANMQLPCGRQMVHSKKPRARLQRPSMGWITLRNFGIHFLPLLTSV